MRCDWKVIVSRPWCGLGWCVVLVLLAGTCIPSKAFAQGRLPDEPDPFVEAVRGIRGSVVAIASYDRRDRPTVRYFGTGFVIDNGNRVVTNQHVVAAVRDAERLDRLQVLFPDQSPTSGRPARVLAEDTRHDVAILAFDGPSATPLRLNVALEPEQGMTVGIVGYPIGTALGLVPAVHRGVVAAVVPSVLPLPAGARITPELAEARRNPYMLYQLDMVVYPGNSGSPLFDPMDGRVVGVINKTLASRTREHLLERPSGIAYAVPVMWIDRLMNEVRRNESDQDRGE